MVLVAGWFFRYMTKTVPRGAAAGCFRIRASLSQAEASVLQAQVALKMLVEQPDLRKASASARGACRVRERPGPGNRGPSLTPVFSFLGWFVGSPY